MSWAVRPNQPSGFRGHKRFIEPCFGIGHNLSLIYQLTSEDIKQHFIIIACRIVDHENFVIVLSEVEFLQLFVM